MISLGEIRERCGGQHKMREGEIRGCKRID